MEFSETIYEIFSEKLFSDEIGEYISYGITDKTGVYKVCDITCSYTEALKILRLLNEYKVSTVHLRDVIYDLLE